MIKGGNQDKMFNKIIACFTKNENLRSNIKKDFGCEGVFLDIGCGWEREHLSIVDAVGIDLNIPHGEIKVNYPIIADAQNIPIRKHSVSFINCQALLEHIQSPSKCMNDMNLALTKNGRGLILIPIDANWPRNMLKRFVKEFPCSIISTVILLYRIMILWKIPGMAHIRKVNLEDVANHFRIINVSILRKPHWYNFGNPFPLRGFLHPLLNGKILVDEFAVWHIWVAKG